MFGKIQFIDNRVLDKVQKLHKPKLNAVMITASKLGTWGTVWWAICLPFLIRPQWRATGINMIFALCVAHLMGEIILKHIVKRVRPCNHLEDEDLIVDRPRFYSFPSGHTTASFAVVGVVLLRCRLITFLPILLLAALIGFSRIYLRVHYLTDVVVGAMLGFVCGVCSVLIFNAAIPVLLPNLIM